MFSVFTHCPQIEKLGWIETSQLMFRSLAGTYNVSSWMREIIRQKFERADHPPFRN